MPGPFSYSGSDPTRARSDAVRSRLIPLTAPSSTRLPSRCDASPHCSRRTAGRLAVVVALVAASSLVSLANPVPGAGRDRPGHSRAERRPPGRAGGRDACGHRGLQRLRRGPDLALDDRRPAHHARALQPASSAHLQRQSLELLHADPRRGGPVAADERHRIGMQTVVTSTRDIHRLERHHRRGHRGCDGRSQLAAVPALRCSSCRLRSGSPGGWPSCVGRSPTARQRTLADMQTQIEESLSVERSAAGQDARHRAGVLANASPSAPRDLVDLEVRSQLAGRWRMATMSVVFAAIPAVIYLGAACR